MPAGLYISIPFCRAKCTYCNFASDVFPQAVFSAYIDRVCEDINRANLIARQIGGNLDRTVDSVYFGGGTPTLLDGTQLERIVAAIRQNFDLTPDAEITVECAPGTLTEEVIGNLIKLAVNRVSLGVQSFVDSEAAAVGRMHKRTTVLDNIARLRAANVTNINIDLIAGLPRQNKASWDFSVEQAIAAGAPHISVYILEVDGDSRLGREIIAGGGKYNANFVPDDDAIADFYQAASEALSQAGVLQYEISNFARAGYESRHNLKYWTRQPYLGFGADAHSMLLCSEGESPAVRFSAASTLEDYMAGAEPERTPVSTHAALEEAFFLGLRVSAGVDLEAMRAEFGAATLGEFAHTIKELVNDGLLEKEADRVRLTTRGRMVSNDVFERFISMPALAG
ncbi:MAG: radical SAM family heme chaperone HemW [Acidobacteriales bacterium]|nr:radical SAM family heme chaperone HemW [Terriglobales bacterium]